MYITYSTPYIQEVYQVQTVPTLLQIQSILAVYPTIYIPGQLQRCARYRLCLPCYRYRVYQLCTLLYIFQVSYRDVPGIDCAYPVIDTEYTSCVHYYISSRLDTKVCQVQTVPTLLQIQSILAVYTTIYIPGQLQRCARYRLCLPCNGHRGRCRGCLE